MCPEFSKWWLFSILTQNDVPLLCGTIEAKRWSKTTMTSVGASLYLSVGGSYFKTGPD